MPLLRSLVIIFAGHYKHLAPTELTLETFLLPNTTGFGRTFVAPDRRCWK
jgi:hypothetical protein